MCSVSRYKRYTLLLSHGVIMLYCHSYHTVYDPYWFITYGSNLTWSLLLRCVEKLYRTVTCGYQNTLITFLFTKLHFVSNIKANVMKFHPAHERKWIFMYKLYCCDMRSEKSTKCVNVHLVHVNVKDAG